MCGWSVAFSFAGRRWVGDRRSAGRACLGGRSGCRWGHPVAGWRGIRDAAQGASPPAWSLGLPLRATPRRVAGHPRRRKGRLTAGVVAWAAAWDNPCAGWRGIRDAAKGASPPAGRLGCRWGQPLRRVAGHSRRRKGRLTAGVVGRRCERLPPCRQGSASAPEPSQGCRSSGAVADLRSPSSGPRPLGRPGLPLRGGWACRALPVADATAPSYGVVVDVSREGWQSLRPASSPPFVLRVPSGRTGEGGGRPQGAPLRKIPPARIEARFPLSRE